MSATASPFRPLKGRHGIFVTLADDRTIARAIEVSGGHAEAEVKLLAALMRPGDTAVELGAAIGSTTVPLARKVGLGGRVIAFEPSRLPFLCLCATVVLNALTQIEPRQMAVGAAPGEAGPGAGTADRVPVVTVDGLGLSSLALLKVDAAAMDRAALDGARETLDRCRPALYLDAGHDGAARAAAIAALQAQGWRWWWHLVRAIEPGTLPEGVTDPFPDAADARLLALPPGHWATPRLPPVSAPDASWRADIAAWQAQRAAGA